MGKKIYDSKHTDKKITAAQYLAEQMCTRLAAKNGKVLSNRFWFEKKWKNYFNYQCLLANKLIKLYNETSVIQAISDRSVRNVYSLALPTIGTLAEKYFKVSDRSVEKETLVKQEVETTQRKEKAKKTLLDLI